MRGKYRAKADTRRDWDALQHRAGRAENDRDRLTAQLTAVTGKYVALQASAQAQARALTADRDQATSPRIRELETLCEQLRAAAHTAREEAEAIREHWSRILPRAVAHVRGCMGVTADEALMVVANWTGVDGVAVTDPTGQAPAGDAGAAVAIGKARRRLSAYTDVLAAAHTD